MIFVVQRQHDRVVVHREERNRFLDRWWKNGHTHVS